MMHARSSQSRARTRERARAIRNEARKLRGRIRGHDAAYADQPRGCTCGHLAPLDPPAPPPPPFTARGICALMHVPMPLQTRPGRSFSIALASRGQKKVSLGCSRCRINARNASFILMLRRGSKHLGWPNLVKAQLSVQVARWRSLAIANDIDDVVQASQALAK